MVDLVGPTKHLEYQHVDSIAAQTIASVTQIYFMKTLTKKLNGLMNRHTHPI